MSILLNSDKRDIKEIYVGVNGIPQKVKEGYVGVDGVPRKFYSAISYDPILNNNTWYQISEASKSGLAPSLWNVGDTKEIIINGTIGDTAFNNLTISVFILGFNHNADIEGQNLTHFGIGIKDDKLVALVDSSYDSYQTATGKFTMNTSQTNAGGWKSSHMRSTVLGSSSKSSSGSTLMAALPSDLRSVMKSVTKYTDNTGGGNNDASYVTSTTDYLWLLAEYEVFGSRSYANSAEQQYQSQYDYFKSVNKKVAYRHNSTSNTCWWWLRSPYYNNNHSFCYVETDGSYYRYSANHSAGVAAAFAA